MKIAMPYDFNDNHDFLKTENSENIIFYVLPF